MCIYQFYIDETGVYTIPSFGDHFWKKYLCVYSHIHIIGEPLKGYLNKEKLVKINMDRISLDILPPSNSPQDWKNDAVIKRFLKKEIKKSSSIIIKPASRKGIMAIKIAERFQKPYLIEITGDLYTALKNQTNPLKRFYAPIIYRQILAAIKNCKFGVYVTDYYLQKAYPITGKTCGASDAVIKSLDNRVYEQRISRIKQMHNRSKIQIGLVGFYHDSNKGIDTAIEALAKLKDDCVYINVLGNGSEQDRQKWYVYADKVGLKREKLVFPEPIVGIDNMFEWYDSMDIVILPSRSEGLPRTIVEAMSRACPCITSNVCGLSELCESVWQHKAGDATRLCNLITEMLRDQNKMVHAASYNFKKSEHYLEEIQLKKRVDFMNEFKKYCEGVSK